MGRKLKSEQRAFVVIIAMIVAFFCGMLFERRMATQRHVDVDLVIEEPVGSHSDIIADAHRTKRGSDGTRDAVTEAVDDDVEVVEPETFSFDPNTANADTLLRLGFTSWQVKALLKYRSRGGRFHRTEDLKRLYYMTPELYERLAQVVRIDKRYRYYDSDELAADEAARRDSVDKHRSPRQEKFAEQVQLDLNNVDTATLKKVPGIASYRARQIVGYRERLGGYVSTSQLAELEGFPVEELAAWFVVDSSRVRRINLNHASVAEMGRHPYIGFARARAIEGYRHKTGRINALSDLRLLPGFDDESLRRIEPYVNY